MKWLWALALLATPLNAQQFVAAGVPRSLAGARDYPALFQHLEENGIAYFFPTFQFAESPTPRGYGYEVDFLLPCSPDDAAFKALRESPVRLIIPGALLYPDPANLPALENDPLTALLACAGDGIAAISNFDEPVSHRVPIEAVAAIYERVKSVAPGMEVLLVFAPVPNDEAEYISSGQRAAYFADIIRYSAFADIIGFDIYPYPEALTKIGSPLRGGRPVPAEEVIADYKRWLEANLPEKRHLTALQGFSLRDMFTNFGPAWGRAPTADQLAQMLKQAGDSELIIWWGQAALADPAQAPWPDILELTKP